MYKKYWDIILVGGGLSNCLIAWWLKHKNYSLNVLMLEKNNNLCGNHIWCFHKKDLSYEQYLIINPLINYRWLGYKVNFPEFNRILKTEYIGINSVNLSKNITDIMNGNLYTNILVVNLKPKTVILSNGLKLKASVVIDGRGFTNSKYLLNGFQIFLGQQWKLIKQHKFIYPILMDTEINQNLGYHFIYTLPISINELLIEDTYYLNNPSFNTEKSRKNIYNYAKKKNFLLKNLEKEERGCLPIILTGNYYSFWKDKKGQSCCGLCAGFSNHTTGYTFSQAVTLADTISKQNNFKANVIFNIIKKFSLEQWRSQIFFRIINRILFFFKKTNLRWKIIQNFYKLNSKLISNFYKNNLSLIDILKILIGKPPVSIKNAIFSLFKYI